MCKVEINGKQAKMMIDSGTSIDLGDECTFKEIYKGKEEIPKDTKRKIFSYGLPTPLPLLVTVKAQISVNATRTGTTLNIVKGSSGNLLGYNTAKQLGMPKIINQIKTEKTGTRFPTNGEFASLFEGIGKVKGKIVKLHIDPDFKPKQQPHR